MLVATCLPGQSYIYDAGSPSYGVNIPIENGFINVTNGNLHMEIHLANHPQRGALKLDEKLVYDSHYLEIGHYSNYYWWPDNVPRTSQMALGWRFVTGGEVGTVTTKTTVYQNTCQYYVSGTTPNNGTITQTNYSATWQDVNGTQHYFDSGFPTQSSTCPGNTPAAAYQSFTTPATDGSGYMITMSGQNTGAPTSLIVKDTNGTQAYPQVIDRYGNYWQFDGNGNLIDDHGQTPVLTTVSGNSIYYDVLAPGGGRARYTVTTAGFPVNTQFHQQAVNDYSGTLNTVTGIQLPDGSSYAFTYEPYYGELAGVTLPTGGAISYKWLTFFDSYNNANRWLSSRTVGSDPPTTFTPQTVTACSSGGTGCREKMTVHQPSGDETVYNLTLNDGAWNTNTQRFSGSASGGTLLSTTDTTYDFSNPCGPNCLGAKYVSAQTVTTTLPVINLKLTDSYSYANEALGLIGSKKRYDFYSGSLPSSPLVETDYVYNGSLTGDIYSISTKDGSGNLLSQQINNYVQSPTTTTSGLPAHGTANAANSYVNSTSQWINTDGSSLVTAYQWDDAGALLAASTPYPSSASASAWTTYLHDSTDTFVTSQTEPATTSKVTLTAGAAFDPSTGVATSTTDYNSQTTTLKNYDSLGRIGEIDTPDGGVTTYSYTPTTRNTNTQVDAKRTGILVEAVDSYGRPNRTALNNGQSSNPWYQRDTCYNGNGQVQSVSLPYSGTGFNIAVQCSGTTYTYEALGRPATVTNADGTTRYTYTGRATKVVDVNGKTKITQVDGLGRLSAVCEVTSQSVAGVLPQNCGLDIPGTGFLTTYSYDIANHRTYTSQGSEGRVVGTDSLGRTVYTSEPERGVTTYTYAYGSSGLVTTRVRPMANQTNPNVTTTMTTQYDALNRPTDVKYTPTTSVPASVPNDYTIFPETYYAYDQQAYGLATANPKGRLTGAAMYPGQGFIAVDGFGYDAMGRLANSSACAPGWCYQPSRNLTRSYGYDLSGNKTTETWFNGARNVTTTYSYTIASELDTMSGGMNDGAMPLFPYFYKAVTHTPNGTASEQYGNGLYGNRLFDSIGRLQGQWECIGTTTPGCGDAAHHVEGYLNYISGDRVNRLLNVQGDFTMGYDDLGRMTSMTTTGASTPTLAWTYDRYGNRLTQNDVQNVGLPHPGYAYNLANQIDSASPVNSPGIRYDAAGNIMNDSFHNYLYDQAGNVRCVDSCNTASDLFDSFNRRVFHVVNNNANTVYRYEHNDQGQETEVWQTDNATVEHTTRYYANGQPFAFWSSADYKLHFNHTDYINTSHARTNDVGQRESTFYSLPFGDGFSASGSDGQDEHFADLDRDGETDTHHATYRTYSSTAGHWMQPDPYDGSYDPSDPQSFNRYSYVGNNPLSLNDPSGQDGEGGEGGVTGGIGGCIGAVLSEGVSWESDLGCAGSIFQALEGLLSKPQFKGSLKPRPGGGTAAGDDPWNETIGFPKGQFPAGGNPISVLGGVFGFPAGSGCEFGACGGIGGDFQNAGTMAGPAIGGAVVCAAAEPCGAIVLGVGAGILVGTAIYQGTEMYRHRGDNAVPKRQFEEALRQIEKRCGRPLTPGDRRRLHDDITKQGFSLDEIVEIGVGHFCPGK